MTINDVARPVVEAALTPADAVIRIGLSQAQARGTKKTRRRARHKAEALEAERKRLEERDQALLGTKTPELGTTCAYDSYASAVNSSEIYTCGGNYYERYEENGVTGFVGHPIGMNREEIKRAMARQAAAEEKLRKEAEKKRKENIKKVLSSDCAYDSYASFTAESNVYTCGGVQFSEFRENGVTQYARGTAGRDDGKSGAAQINRASGVSRSPDQAAGKPQVERRANLPENCSYDTYVSFFTSSNVYDCNGVRYRQVREKGTTVYEILEL